MQKINRRQFIKSSCRGLLYACLASPVLSLQNYWCCKISKEKHKDYKKEDVEALEETIPWCRWLD
ncbi:hypothetical protein ACFL35_20710 [Candidatus Riflebacteria bacterium]